MDSMISKACTKMRGSELPSTSGPIEFYQADICDDLEVFPIIGENQPHVVILSVAGSTFDRHTARQPRPRVMLLAI
jgi:hypothetical protein